MPGLLSCTLYILSCIALGELLGRGFKLGSGFTRKAVHISVGMVVWFLPLWFDSPWPFVTMCAIFAGINFLDWKYHFFPGMSSTDAQNLGTVYFPLAIAAVVLAFWGQIPLMVAAAMPLTWGDGLAPVFGRWLGRHRYTVLGHTRSWEGSAAFFVFATVAVLVALLWLPAPPQIGIPAALGAAIGLAGLTAAVEGVTPWGLDNLSITAVAILFLQILF